MNYKLKQGFSLFLAIIVIGALILIAFSVVAISVKETEFSVSNRESQFAIFAADAGIECAAYWDAKPAVSKFDPATSGSPINCAGVSIANGSANIYGTTTANLIGASPISTFSFPLNAGANPTNACIVVMVYKNANGSTHINSYGYNTCSLTDPRRVERGIEITY